MPSLDVKTVVCTSGQHDLCGYASRWGVVRCICRCHPPSWPARAWRWLADRLAKAMSYRSVSSRAEREG